VRVAVLADIHGNLPALEAVLRDVDAAGADAIVLAGDMTVGPLQAETLDLLNSLGEKVIWVRGNCERAVVEVFDGSYRPTGAPHEPGVIWAGQQLTRAQRDRLASLPMTVSLQVDGLGAVLFCHATARDDEEIVLVDSPVEWFDEGFADVEEQTLVCGHTHMPFDRLAAGRRVINPGSVGMPYGPPGAVAHWALLGPDVTLRRSACDLGQAAERLRAAPGPAPPTSSSRTCYTDPRATPRRLLCSPTGPDDAARADLSFAVPRGPDIARESGIDVLLISAIPSSMAAAPAERRPRALLRRSP
jgi:putative phosphoesterase